MPFTRNNYRPVRYDHGTNSYNVAGIGYPTYDGAKANQWQCDRCAAVFSVVKRLKDHKSEMHSY
jgi:hypothetical protein